LQERWCRSWPSVSVESIDSEYWCLNNAIVYAFIMRLTAKERVLRSTFKLNTLYIGYVINLPHSDGLGITTEDSVPIFDVITGSVTLSLCSSTKNFSSAPRFQPPSTCALSVIRELKFHFHRKRDIKLCSSYLCHSDFILYYSSSSYGSRFSKHCISLYVSHYPQLT